MCDEAKPINDRYRDLIGADADNPDPRRAGNINLPELPHKIVTEEDLKDLLHCRLNARCEFDHNTDCWIWTGAWQTETGLGVLRTGGKMFMVSRVAAWVYLGGFDIFDTRTRIEHVGSCPNPACFNYEHLVILHEDRCGINARFAGSIKTDEDLADEKARRDAARKAKRESRIETTVAPSPAVAAEPEFAFAGKLF